MGKAKKALDKKSRTEPLDKSRILYHADFRRYGNLGWFDDHKRASLLISAYRVLNPHPDPHQKFTVIRTTDAVLFLVYGRISYLESSGRVKLKRGVAEIEADVQTLTSGMKVAPPDFYVVILQPCCTGRSGENSAESFARALERRHALAALLSCVTGIATVHELIFQNEMDALGNDLFVHGSLSVRREHAMTPFVNEARINSFVKARSAIAASAGSEDRLMRALHWYDLGCRAADSVEAYVNLWVSLECLIMRGPGIAPLKASMARAYGISPESAAATFGLGLLCRLRGTVLHHGYRISIVPDLISLISAIFVDVLFEQVGIACERRAEDVLNGKPFQEARLINEDVRALLKRTPA